MDLRWRLAILTLLLAGCQGTSDIRWGHTPSEPSSSFAMILAQDTSATVTAFADTDTLISAVQNGEVSFALIEQPPSPVDGLSIVTSIFPSVLHILVHRNITDCSEPVLLDSLLTQGKIYAGTSGSTGRVLLDQLARAEWLPPVSTLKVLDDPFGEQPQIFFQFGGILPVDAARRLSDYCLASIGVPDRIGRGTWAEGVGFRFPHLSAFILPAGLYPRLNTNPVLTLAVTSILVTHADTDPDVVYDAAQLVHEAANKLSEIYPLAGPAIHSDPSAQQYVLPLHPGAERFARRNAPTFIERYAEFAALILTALVASTSAGIAVIRLRRQTKKDRIDEYLSQLLEFRNQLASETIEGVVIARQTRSLQGVVTQLVVDERIQADSAYVAFLSLSNRIIEECED